MKKPWYFIGSLLLLAACAPKVSNIQTAVIETETASPTGTDTPQPTITLTPSPTRTPRPTFTPTPTITLPDIVKDTLDNPKVLYWQNFDQSVTRSSPSGWTGNPNMPFVNSELALGLRGQSVGFYYGNTIVPNNAVVTRFKFGANPSFTIGIYVAKGRELIPNRQPGSRSLSLASRLTPMITNYVDGKGTVFYFDKLVELEIDRWYMFMLGFTKYQTYFIKVWDPENPDLMLTFEQQLANMPSSYTFVYWAGEDTEISIDDFTILRFSSLREVESPDTLAEKIPVIIDTDMAVDDWMAILYLLNRADVDVKAITVSGTGEAHCDPGVKNAASLVALSGHDPVPVACGSETPLQGTHTFPDDWRSHVDSMSGLQLPNGVNPAGEVDAVQLLQSTLANSEKPVSVLALGPLTNLAEFLTAYPEMAPSIERITIMGGAVHVPGNLLGLVEDNKSAEWNIYVDPKAANLVLGSGVPVTLVPLDATNQTPLTPIFFNRLKFKRTTSEADFVYEVLNNNQEMIQSGTYYFWDPLAAGVLTDGSIATYEDYPICVIEEEGETSGQTVIEEGCPSIQVAISANRDLFEQIFLETLNIP